MKNRTNPPDALGPGRMKRRLGKITGVLLLILAAGTGLAWAQGSLTEKQRWIEQVDGGFVVPASGNVTGYLNPGYGGDILVGYRFDRAFSLSVDLGYYDCDQRDPAGAEAGEWIYVPLMGVARWNLGGGTFRPYVLLGLGAAFNNYSQTVPGLGKLVHRETDFLLAPGLGVLCVVASDMALYVQGRVDMDFVTDHEPGTPRSDSPTIFIPLKAGLAFFVL